MHHFSEFHLLNKTADSTGRINIQNQGVGVGCIFSYVSTILLGLSGSIYYLETEFLRPSAIFIARDVEDYYDYYYCRLAFFDLIP